MSPKVDQHTGGKWLIHNKDIMSNYNFHDTFLYRVQLFNDVLVWTYRLHIKLWQKYETKWY